MALTGVHADYVGNRHRNGECGFSPLSVRGVTRCMCYGYPATTLQGDCTVCGAGYYETMEEYEADIPPVACKGKNTFGDPCKTPYLCKECFTKHNSGRVQEESPIKVYAYRGDIPTVIQGVREESITVEDRKGVLTLVFEFMDGSRIGYFPHIDWYSTECDLGF